MGGSVTVRPIALIESTLGAARAAAFERVDLTVYRRNERAARLYRQAGFRDAGVRIRGKKLDGEYDDELLMQILLEQR